MGDGSGGSENYIGKYTKQNCITAVREKYPAANGATMEKNCPSTCRCYAEFGMTSWIGGSRSSYQSCMFIKGECCCHAQVFFRQKMDIYLPVPISESKSN